ncbi:insecticidal delta-endotoxin Cry8Ea1 family protein [Bacillus thuringiensis]|uniref:insecticidal delta-endotoxin Cry8Ea1 family protein n=1 Tax=Bacillus thuringiensis TaxID=1428 RepID=UPI000DC09B63|nr:insecticidal delta-endotoxin Cry8Ea1 family protein [Bacillus thuringiensis]MEC2709907.1 insecticidal delta-endotoxin Cry8Ea1 family protein [Bacillus thuringiensis]
MNQKNYDIIGASTNGTNKLLEGYNIIISPYEAPTSVTTTIEITGTILSDLGVPGASSVSLLLNKLLNILWPNDANTVWGTFAKETADLLNEVLSADDPVVIQANENLEGLKNTLDLYLQALKEWKNDPQNPASQERVRTRFRNVDDDFTHDMPSFAKVGYETKLLTVYAQAANLHLLLLRDASMFGEGWGMTQTNINDNYNRQLRLTAHHTDYSVKWYNAGLEKLKGNLTGENWYTYNRFRREMTLMVLDIVALFPNYDARMYPIATSSELTRMIYTDPIAYTQSDPWYKMTNLSFSSIENSAIPIPSFFRWLKSVSINSQWWGSGSNQTYYWVGHELVYSNSNYNQSLKVKYGDPNSYIEPPDSISFSSTDVYRTISVVRNSISNYIVSEVQFNSISNTNQVSEEIYKHQSNWSRRETKDSITELSLAANPPTTFGNVAEYSHRLAYISEAYQSHNPSKYPAYIPVFGWTHTSVRYDNKIFPDKITQIPAVKSSSSEGGTWQNIAKGPGFTGGDVTTAVSPAVITDVIKIHVTLDTNSLSQKYRARLRYASNANVNATLYTNSSSNYNFELTKGTTETFTTYYSYQYVDIPGSIQFNTTSDTVSVYLHMDSTTNANVHVDRIEFIPVDENYDERVTLEKAQKAVNALFTAGRHALQTDVTDYKVDQVSILVDCVSGELYQSEKRELLSLVKYAKRLSYSRNLLLDPTFDSINSSEENGWYGSNGIAIGNGNFVFKGNYLIFSGTNDTQYPTYLYQKIDESKLKEYTRYKLRGFIESSQDLEAYVIRYDAKHETLDVSNNLFPDISPVNACGEPNRCAVLPYLDENPRLECSSIQDGILSDSHSFSLNIDTGSIDSNENVGIWVLFKISTPEGYAKFGNLEVIENGPVIGEALARVKRQETKWRNQLIQLRTETQAIYTRAKQALDNLFANAQDSHLKIGATFASIVAARKIVQSIREAYMSWLSIVPDVNYPIFTELNERVQQAFQLYDVRNVVRNGRFLSGLSDWIVTSDVKVQEDNGNNVLVLSNWDAQVLQCLKLYQDRGYILRVTARKEGLGEGYVTITDEEGHTDQLTFGTCEEIDASNTFVSTGYITKELEFFPDTEKVRIEIGETEGTFQVESVELFLMEDLC